jgi:hypothetical protein
MTNLDQPEIEARIGILTLKARYLAAELETATGQKQKNIVPTGADILADLEALETHCAELESALGVRSSARLPDKTPVPALATISDESFLQRVLKENNCSTVAELKAHCEIKRLEKLVPQLTGISLKSAQKKLEMAKAKLLTTTNKRT